MRHLVDGRAGDGQLPVDRADPYPGVALDLGERGLDHVVQRHRFPPYPGSTGTTEHQQALVDPCHPGGEVVRLVELFEPVRVGLVALHPVDLGQHRVDQPLLASGQVDEDLRDVGPQRRLYAGDPYRLAMQSL